VKDKLDGEDDPEVLKSMLADQDFITRLNDEDFHYYTEKVDVDAFEAELFETAVDSYPEVYEALYQSMATASSHFDGDPEDARYVSKSVLETEFFPELLEWFPDVKFVCVLRNPYGHFNAARNSIRADRSRESSPDFHPIKHPYPFIGSEIRRMKGSYYFMEKYQDLYPDNFYVCVFDDVLQDPEGEMRDLADFLDIEFEESMLRPTICGDLWGGNSMHADEFEGISQEPLYHWKEHIGDLEIRLMNEFFEDTIREYGFDYLESDASLFQRLHPSEWNPATYAANRLILKWGVDSADTF
jgi:hypothetical protein